MIFSAAQLRHISTEIDRGRGLWGIFIANEILSSNGVLRRALVASAANNLRSSALHSTVGKTVVKKALAGKPFSALTKREQEFVRLHTPLPSEWTFSRRLVPTAALNTKLLQRATQAQHKSLRKRLIQSPRGASI